MKAIMFIVKRKILVGLMTVLIILLGCYSVFKLDKELLPNIKMDGAYVEISAGEMAAVEVERTITNPLEQKLKGLNGIEDIQSTSSIGRSTISVNIKRGKGDEVFKEVESIANSLKGSVSGVTEVHSGQYGTSQNYEFFMDISNGNMEEMTAFAKNVLEPRLEALKEVRDVALVGTVEREVSIEFSREKMDKYSLDATQVIGALQNVNNEATLGELSNDKDTPSIRWNTKLENIDDVKSIKIPTSNGNILLKDIANVSVQPLESSSYVWKNGTKDFILVQVGRTSDVSQIQMADAIRAEVENIRKEHLIKGFEINEVVAQADYVKESIDGVTDNILIGGIIAVAVLLLFLRNLRATFIIGISIPTSVLLTFATIWLFDYSFNIITLIGLGLGIGMMVDSSIVILESIYKKREQGLSKFDAVIEGTKEVSSAVIASMLTTIVVFLPIGFIQGEMAQFMVILSTVVAITLISSVIIAFTIIPVLSEKLLKLRNKKKVKESPFLRSYNALVAWTIKKKRRSLGIIFTFIFMLVGSFFLVNKIPMNIMPDMYNRYAELMINLEPGLSNKDKEEVVHKINEKLQSIKDVETNYVMDNGGALYAIINMTKGEDIVLPQKEVNEQILKNLRDLRETTPIKNVQSAMDEGGGSPVQVNIKGENFEELQKISNDFMNDFQSIDGIVGATSSMKRTSQEQVIQLKEKEIEAAGLSPIQIRHLIEQAFLQMPVGEITFNEENIPLNVKWDEKTSTKSALLDLNLPLPDGEKKLSSFINLKTIETPNEIRHTDGERFMSITADIEGKDLGGINRDVQSLINDFNAPDGYTISVAGNLEAQQDLMKDLLFVFAIALFLVYLVMAVQFNHLGHPLIVMSVIPMTIVGVILGLFFTQMELNLMSGIGIVMLIGIVLNNAILLIDRTNQLRKEGYSIEDALVEAGKNRIRPIFMTTLTTAGGMLPLALASGTSGNYQAPMATAIISGLMFATFITLLLVPATYRLFSFSRAKVERVKVKGKNKKLQVSVTPDNV
ncbi:efflux RND transporter permease subunit [Lederbergia wuyishanensis]|uniref:HAE1 family hydrophobic/amphiphilic exporter-1 n=1 Tax=Lederbergia wuyishanensis TaxID=1347903 RepID=A0ABU0D7U7_9BACI|nr:efflux RND transporter permease subunit [Lederbergia wuyishanensis]MCJ8009102.1 efflux RND transporter permease subunit [Lederbergia wuyishanensis]MDQ0344440.1 HAE1 family hydrophobic/amphiphilic exporter-1 [Lederbergia wuyishanensis]